MHKKKKKIVIDRGYATTSVPSLVKEKDVKKSEAAADDATIHVASSPPISPRKMQSPCQSPLAQPVDSPPSQPAPLEINKEYKTAHLSQPKVVLGESQRAVVSLPRHLEKSLTQLLECPKPPALLPTAASMRVLNSVYLHMLSLGFPTAQVEKALAAVVDTTVKCPPELANDVMGLTEAYVDTCMAWLCLNIPHNDLPAHWTNGRQGEEDLGAVSGLTSPRGSVSPRISHLASPRGAGGGNNSAVQNALTSPRNSVTSPVGVTSPRNARALASPRTGQQASSSSSSPYFGSNKAVSRTISPHTTTTTTATTTTATTVVVTATTSTASPSLQPALPLMPEGHKRRGGSINLGRPDPAIKERIQQWQDSDDNDTGRNLIQELGAVKIKDNKKTAATTAPPTTVAAATTTTGTAAVRAGPRLQYFSPPMSPNCITTPISLSAASSPIAASLLHGTSSSSSAPGTCVTLLPLNAPALMLPAPLILTSAMSQSSISSPRAVGSPNPTSPISPQISQEGFELDFDLFEKKEGGDAGEKKPEDTSPQNPLALRKPTQDYCYNKKWSGLSPWVRLKQQCQKDKSFGKVEVIPIAPEFSYHQLKLNIYNVGNGSVAHTFAMDEQECCYTREEAENVIATKALYVLNAGTSFYQQLPPPFRQLWLSWIAQEQQRKDDIQREHDAVEHAEHLRRLTFVYSLLQSQQQAREEKEKEREDESKKKVSYSLPPLAQLLANPFGPLSQISNRVDNNNNNNEEGDSSGGGSRRNSLVDNNNNSNNGNLPPNLLMNAASISTNNNSNGVVSPTPTTPVDGARGSSTDGWDTDGESEATGAGWEELAAEQERDELENHSRSRSISQLASPVAASSSCNGGLGSCSSSSCAVGVGGAGAGGVAVFPFPVPAPIAPTPSLLGFPPLLTPSTPNAASAAAGPHSLFFSQFQPETAAEDSIHQRLAELLSPHHQQQHHQHHQHNQREEYGMFSEDTLFRESFERYDPSELTRLEIPELPEIQCQDADSGVLREMFHRVQTSADYQHMLHERTQLPIFPHRESLIRALQSSDVALIAGETGSGKTTQVPQYILEDMMQSGCGASCNIIVTQPRRISAQGVAARVAAELGQTCGELCGYQIKMESRKSAATRVLYCTTGILLRRLQTDRLLEGVSHVIIDEVHERTLHSDFLMVLLRRILELRRQQSGYAAANNGWRPGNLQLVLMSATMDTESLQRYYVDAGFTCPSLSISGRTFPVDEFFLDEVLALASSGNTQMSLTQQTGTEWPDEKINFNLIEDLLLFLDQQRPDRGDFERDPNKNPHLRFGVEGAVLIFMAGLKDIDRLNQRLQGSRVFGDPNRYRIFALHSSLAGSGPGVFAVPPRGVRKIVIATNIAETGITIPDVVFVIDIGRMKQVRYNSRTKLSSLKEIYVAKANATQRAGRAGRVQPGFCFRFFTRELYASLPQNWQPEMLRMPLEELCLHILDTDLGESPSTLLAGALSPPSPERVLDALTTLEQVGAVRKVKKGKKRQDEEAQGSRGGEVEYDITPLGRVLAQLPVDVQIARMAVFGALLRCLDPILVIAAASTCTKPLFKGGNGVDSAQLPNHVKHSHSDHLVVYHAYRAWRKTCDEAGKPSLLTRGGGVSYAFCTTFNPPIHEASILELQAVKLQLCELLLEAGFGDYKEKPNQTYDSPMSLNTHSNNLAVIRAALAAGLYPRVACVQGAGRDQNGEPVAMFTETRHHKRLYVHPSSLNHQYNLRASSSSAAAAAAAAPSTATTPRKNNGPPTPSTVVRYLPGNWMVYMEKIQTARVFIRETSVVGALPLLLLCGSPPSVPSSLRVLPMSRVIVLDNWMEVTVAPKTAVLIKLLSQEFQGLMLQQVRLQHSGGGGGGGGGEQAEAQAPPSPRRIASIMNIVIDALGRQTH